jgi:monovalent cation/proton antiporter, MnhG/PhaG subunit
LIEILTSALLILGAVLMFAGSFGLVRFPDFFHRIHAAGIPGTLGVGALLIAASLYLSSYYGYLVIKPLMALIILIGTIALGTEMLARAAYITNLKPPQGYVRDDTLQRDVEHTDAVE